MALLVLLQIPESNELILQVPVPFSARHPPSGHSRSSDEAGNHSSPSGERKGPQDETTAGRHEARVRPLARHVAIVVPKVLEVPAQRGSLPLL